MVDLLNKKNINGFSLAEVLITLGIIGIVAAMTLPTLLTNLQESIRIRSATVFARKISEAFEVMQASEKLANYSNTTEFVNELKNFLKIEKICDFNHISDCWPYKNIKIFDGSVHNIESISNAASLFKTGETDPNGNAADYNSEIVAFNIIDGTSVIIGYNSLCNEHDQKAIENCYVGLFEINGKRAPNTLGKDAILINSKYFVNFASGLPTNPIECTGNICSRGGNLTDPVLTTDFH